MARGLEAAGSNANGAMAGFMGMGMASNVGGGMMGAASNTNMAQMQMQQQQQMGAAQQPQQPVNNAQPTAGAGSWTCSCGQVNSGKFCSECGKPAPSADWTCSCGQVNSGKFCSNCGSPRP